MSLPMTLEAPMGAIHLDGLEHPTSNKHAPSADTPSSDSDVKASGSKSSSSNNDVKESGLISSSPSDSKTPTHNEGNAASEDEPDIKLGPLRTAAILLGLSFSIFIIGLDQNIVATSIPVITNHFDSFQDVGWYGSAYLLTLSAFQLFWGRVYKVLPIKGVFLSTVALFELGSLVSGAAPTSIAVIVGRAISGFGCAGILSGTFIIIGHTVPLRWRPFLNSLIGIFYGASTAIGPLVGGVFTSKVSWRWSFFINLPIGALAAFLVAITTKISEPEEKKNKTLQQKLREFDWIGTILFVPSIICILLALQWGGSTYAWDSGRVIALIIIFVLGTAAFVHSQIQQGERSTVPPRIMKQRSMAFASAYAFCLSAAFDILQYFLPIWFQAVKGVSPIKSGIMSLPFMLGFALSAVVAGALISWWGQYVPFMLLGSVMLATGAGLCSTYVPDIKYSKWIGYELLAGIGVGFGFDQPQIAAQTVFGLDDISISVTVVTSFATFGSAMFLSVGQNVLNNRLVNNLRKTLPNVTIDPGAVLANGATNLAASFPAQDRAAVLSAYNLAVTSVWYVSVAMAALSFFMGLGMEWKSVKSEEKKKDEEAPAQECDSNEKGEIVVGGCS